MVSIATAVLTVAILVFGEITPEELRDAERGKDIHAVYPCDPVYHDHHDAGDLYHQPVLRFIMLLLRVDPTAVKKGMTEEELRTIVDVSHERGVIETGEKEMINNVFDLGDANAKGYHILGCMLHSPA